MSDEQRRWLSVEQAADYTGTDADWIMAHVNSGALFSVVTAARKKPTGPGHYRRKIDRHELDALMERLKTGPVRPRPPAQGEPVPAKRPPVVKREGIREMWKRSQGG